VPIRELGDEDKPGIGRQDIGPTGPGQEAVAQTFVINIMATAVPLSKTPKWPTHVAVRHGAWVFFFLVGGGSSWLIGGDHKLLFHCLSARLSNEQ